MEALIFLLFILFSLFSALMERRKRKQRQLAQQRQGEAARLEQSQEPSHREEEEEDDQGWPFPVDPFELETKRPRRVDVVAAPRRCGRRTVSMWSPRMCSFGILEID